VNRGRVRYSEGDWIAVPLPHGGYGIGLIARKGRRGVLLGYFFCPRYDRVPDERATDGRKASEAILVEQFGDLGVLSGDWPVVKTASDWKRTEWPVPDFGWVDSVNPAVGYRTTYSDDLDECVREVRVSADEARSLPEEGLSGFIALTIRFENVLDRQR